MFEQRRQRRRDEEGFSLVELMVVVLIIGILIAIALPTFLGARTRAQDRAAQSNLRNAVAAAKVYYQDGQTYTGFTETVADGIEPSMGWEDTDGPSVFNRVTINTPTGGGIFEASTRSASNAFFCVRDDASSGITRGGIDATGAANCTTNTW